MMGSVIESQVPQLTVLASGLGNLSRVIETMDVSLVKANVDCEKTMKTRSMMVSVNKMMNLQAVDLVKNKLETRWPDCQWNVTHFKSFSLRKDGISL